MIDVKIREAHSYRDIVFDRLQTNGAKSGWAHQHHLWPCVRRGAGERWLELQGRQFKPSKTASLYFLRGHSAEQLIIDQNKERIVIVYKGVACRPDLMTGEADRPFVEIKSTNFSSFNFWKLVQAGGLDMSSPFAMRNYLEQSARYCVALNVTGCYLLVYFLHGDYADRRTKCPACSNKLGPWVDDHYRQCEACGYKSKKGDLWVYELDFTPEYLAKIDAEYDSRGNEFRNAIKAKEIGEVLALTSAEPCFHCRDCAPGIEMGCEFGGKVIED